MARKVLPSRHVETLTLEQAKGLSTRTTLYHTVRRNADGTALRARVTSVRTWKTRPNEIMVTAHYGIHSMYYHIDETDLWEWSLDDPTRAQEVPGEEHPS